MDHRFRLWNVRTASGIVIKLKQPQAKTFTIDKSIVFPTEQVHRILEAARADKSILELAVYDGSDNGEKVYNTLTVIGQPIPGARAPTKPDVGSDNEALKLEAHAWCEAFGASGWAPVDHPPQ